MKDLAGATIGPEDYERLKALCRGGTPPPASYEAWQALQEVAHSEAAALGLPTAPLPFDVDEFKGWCGRVGIHPCLEAMRAFMIVKRYGNRFTFAT